mmetsp:Transcript_8466/g.23313  ORF Transcript_8466/g.23313 Transcript_8466/m.23313 type:complete len:222 (-) Transcript_8466:455-1120(-)
MGEAADRSAVTSPQSARGDRWRSRCGSASPPRGCRSASVSSTSLSRQRLPSARAAASADLRCGAISASYPRARWRSSTHPSRPRASGARAPSNPSPTSSTPTAGVPPLSTSKAVPQLSPVGSSGWSARSTKPSRMRPCTSPWGRKPCRTAPGACSARRPSTPSSSRSHRADRSAASVTVADPASTNQASLMGRRQRVACARSSGGDMKRPSPVTDTAVSTA